MKKEKLCSDIRQSVLFFVFAVFPEWRTNQEFPTNSLNVLNEALSLAEVFCQCLSVFVMIVFHNMLLKVFIIESLNNLGYKGLPEVIYLSSCSPETIPFFKIAFKSPL